MARINVLGFDIANLIAAGEVVDRPSSVVKELCENSIDAGAKNVTVEIKHGGTTYIRVSDNGCGIDGEDIPLSVLRHATSKISKAEDLASIGTLGFRGEALAAIAAVCRLKIVSKTADSPMGTEMECEGGEIVNLMETGCAKGTSVVVRELFYNVPARRKFLKKDATETAAVSAVMEKIALSEPGVAIKYITDGEVRFMTSGDGDLRGVIYSIYGRDTASRLIEIDRDDGNGIRVTGYVSEPDMLRSNRNSENFFINCRFVKSKTAMASLEQAYATRIPKEKFPFAVLNIHINPGAVDVNVHPSKLEVKFANERVIFEAIYYAVLSALEGSTKRPELSFAPAKTSKPAVNDILQKREATKQEIKKEATPISPAQQKPEPKKNESFFVTGDEARKVLSAFVPVENDHNKFNPNKSQIKIEDEIKKNTPVAVKPEVRVSEIKPQISIPAAEKTAAPVSASVPAKAEKAVEPENDKPKKEEIPDYIIIGEVYNCYVIIQLEDRMLMLDKHAAHERILFDELCKKMKSKAKHSQILMLPLNITLSEGELVALEEYDEQIRSLGFVYRIEKSHRRISVTEIPDELNRDSASDMISELAARLLEGTGSVEAAESKYFEAKLYQASCKAAIKGGRVYNTEHIKWICDRLLKKPDGDGAVIKTCPHGRPVAFEIKKSSIERQFNRIQ